MACHGGREGGREGGSEGGREGGRDWDSWINKGVMEGE